MKPRNTDLTFTLGEIKGANICLATQTTMSAFRELEMAGWHHWLDGPESGWTPGVGDGHGGLACCDSWGRKESDTTERLNWTELNWTELNAATSTGPSKGTPDCPWSAQRQSYLRVALCFGIVLFFFLSVQLVRQMEMHVCHYGSINGLDFLDVILFNGARAFIA